MSPDHQSAFWDQAEKEWKELTTRIFKNFNLIPNYEINLQTPRSQLFHYFSSYSTRTYSILTPWSANVPLLDFKSWDLPPVMSTTLPCQFSQPCLFPLKLFLLALANSWFNLTNNPTPQTTKLANIQGSLNTCFHLTNLIAHCNAWAAVVWVKSEVSRCSW